MFTITVTPLTHGLVEIAVARDGETWQAYKPIREIDDLIGELKAAQAQARAWEAATVKPVEIKTRLADIDPRTKTPTPKMGNMVHYQTYADGCRPAVVQRMSSEYLECSVLADAGKSFAAKALHDAYSFYDSWHWPDECMEEL